jgi:uncharacterized membrane protein
MKIRHTTGGHPALSRLAVIPALVALLSLGTSARAQLSFLIQPGVQSAKPGSLLSYSATLTNNGSSRIFLNSDTFSLTGAGLVLDDTPFFLNFPLSLTGGQTVTGGLFTVQIGPNVATGLYNGIFTVQGGVTSTALTNLATQSFSVGVTSAPEPASAPLLLLGGIALTAVYARRRQRTTHAERP